jgi:hypothetical protein
MNRSGNGMNRALAVLIMLLVMPAPSAAYQYEPVSYVNSGVSITVSIRAKTSWTAPFAEAVNVSVIATPLVDGVVGVNITSVSIIVNSEQADQSSFILIAAAEETGSPLATGDTSANYSTSMQIVGDKNGQTCFFAVLVAGAYSNVTVQEYFQSASPDNLVGPFTILASVASPIVWVGLIVVSIFMVVFVAGMYGVKKSRKRTRRHHLEE